MKEVLSISTDRRTRKPAFKRSEISIWGTDFPPNARHLGRRVVEEILKYYGGEASDSRVIGIAIDLADQDPPLPADISWPMYDGVREELAAQHEHAMKQLINEDIGVVE